MLTTTQTAKRLGVTPRFVLALIKTNRLKAEKIGRDWMITEAELAAFVPRKRGRPRKATAE